jgi:hypothetical protein
MRVVHCRLPTGDVYKIYRSGDDFLPEMRRLIPFIYQCAAHVYIGGTDEDPDVIITVGPLDAATDAAFRRRVGSHLEN